MYLKHVTIKNPTGLHARPATQLVHLAEQYRSSLEILKASETADMKSIFSLLAVGLAPGTEITVRGEGTDEKEAVESVCKFIESLEE